MDGFPKLEGARAVPVSFAELSGWRADDHEAALAVLAAMAFPPHAEGKIREAQPNPTRLAGLIDKAARISRGGARTFFEQHFTPFRIETGSGTGFLTAYFEPEYSASRQPSADFPAPVLAQPGRDFKAGPDAPKRAEIEAGALAGRGLELGFMHPVDLFFMQVQGSGRLSFADGGRMRLAYAGRNGHPYTSIGKVTVAEGHMLLEEMTLAGFTGWLKANPDHAARIMRMNESYVFFRELKGLPDQSGPIGGAGYPLTAHRSIAIDRTVWPYGLPFWLEADLPLTLIMREAVKRLMIAQDTGSAIIGPARADYFMGTGPEAGERAGLVRQPSAMTVLWPKGVS
jgi:membrane-bound lytic murein transglycosylase A